MIQGNATRALLPPYAKRVGTLNGAVWIYCGTKAWKVRELQKGAARDCSIIMPEEREPQDYRWPVERSQVFIVGLDADITRCARLVLCCIDAGATEVWLIHEALKDGLVRYEGKAWKRCA